MVQVVDGVVLAQRSSVGPLAVGEQQRTRLCRAKTHVGFTVQQLQLMHAEVQAMAPVRANLILNRNNFVRMAANFVVQQQRQQHGHQLHTLLSAVGAMYMLASIHLIQQPS